MTEKKSLELLTELKKKWQYREEERGEKIQNALKKSESKRVALEKNLRDAKIVVDAKDDEISSLIEVKTSLKAKLKECKSRLEETVGKYHDEHFNIRKGRCSLPRMKNAARWYSCYSY